MNKMFRLGFVLLGSVVLCKASNLTNKVRKFPTGFLFGTSTASYQIEGAWNEDGKSENIWDHLTHNTPGYIVDFSNGYVADDSYHLYKRDVEMIRELGLDFYRFSLAWSRILPTSFPNIINEAGVKYYNNLIDELLKYNIEPMVTLYHWDLPQRLQDLGGWANPHIVDWFADYARIAFERFGDRVKYWTTINEPHEICYLGYGINLRAPVLNIDGIANYLCDKNVLLAHAKAYHVYDQEYRHKFGGSIFISFSAQWFAPEKDEYAVAADEANQFEWQIHSHPIFSTTGDFPPAVKKNVAAKSAEQGYFRSRLPEFTPEEIEYVKGTSDYFGLNHYTTYLVYRNKSVYGYHPVPSFYDDMGVLEYQSLEWGKGASDWLSVVPWGFHDLLMEIKEKYGNPPVIITENGYSNHGGLIDDDRISYYRLYLNALLDAIDNGCDIRGYSTWSMMDTFEWMYGHTVRFGLYEVDFESPNRTRTPRKSAFVYKEIVRSRTLDFNYEPDTSDWPDTKLANSGSKSLAAIVMTNLFSLIFLAVHFTHIF